MHGPERPIKPFHTRPISLGLDAGSSGVVPEPCFSAACWALQDRLPHRWRL